MRRSIRFPAMLCSAILLFGTDRYAHAEKVVEIVNVNCGGHQWEPESTMTGRANPKDRGAAPVAGTGCFTPDCYYDGNRVFVFYTGLNSSHPKGVPQSSPDLQPEHIMVAVSASTRRNSACVFSAAILEDFEKRKSPTNTAAGIPQTLFAAFFPLLTEALSITSSCKRLAA